MDYRQKMVVQSPQKFKTDDDDDEDLEALRLAALKSLRTKDAIQNKRPPPLQLQKSVPSITQTVRPSYKSQRPPRRGYFHNRLQQRQNGNFYFQSHCNPNLIAIVPVDEHSALQQTTLSCSVKGEKTEMCIDTRTPVSEVSKFHRFKDSGSCSEEEDAKEHKNAAISTTKSKSIEQGGSDTEQALADAEEKPEITESPRKNEDQEDLNDDDDDILLMADLEEEDSLERLMDEMEREMNVDKPSEKREKKSSKKDSKESGKFNESVKNNDQKAKMEEIVKKDNNGVIITSSMAVFKSDRRSVSPHTIMRINQKRRSLSPKLRSRKKSPRRSPRRSPIRQLKKSQREMTRYRSPRISPPRYSPRYSSRSPRLSPRRSPNRSPIRRSPLRKLSPRGRSPKLSPQSRSPRLQRSRSPRILSRSKSPKPIRSPKVSRSRSPRLARSRSPRQSPLRLTPQLRSSRSKSPRMSPRRMSPPRRVSPRLRSPVVSPRRRSPRSRSPKMSPRRTPSRLRSPRLSPHRSPWSSPRNSPHLSPRRRRSPRWSPKELPRKHGPRSISPDDSVNTLYKRDSPVMLKTRTSPESNRLKSKQKEESLDKAVLNDIIKECSDIIHDPVLEARRRKFESTRPIDPINANKKIKLNKKEDVSKRTENADESDTMLGNTKKSTKVTEDYDVQEEDLCLSTSMFEFEELDDALENASPTTLSGTTNQCLTVEPSKVEKDKPSKKKKKRDKEIYQVGKLKNELPLSERIGKDKKCKKRKDTILDTPNDDVDAIFEDINVDEEGDLRAELSRRRAERLNRTVPIQSARLVQSAFKGVVNEVVKSNAKVNQRHVIKTDEKSNQKDVRRVTVLHRTVSNLDDSEDDSTLDSKVPVRFRLGLNKQVQDIRDTKVSRKSSKRQTRKE